MYVILDLGAPGVCANGSACTIDQRLSAYAKEGDAAAAGKTLNALRALEE
jgi:hypothetical protein